MMNGGGRMTNNGARTFKPTLRERQILAGGMRICEVDDSGRVIFDDRFRRRCVARGTDDVPVYVVDLMELLLEHYREGAG